MGSSIQVQITTQIPFKKKQINCKLKKKTQTKTRTQGRFGQSQKTHSLFQEKIT